MSSPSVQPQNDDESANSVPDDLPEASQIDSLIATQMSRLSTNEREKAYFDIHGISGEIEESPEMIKESMAALEKEISKIKSKEAYQKAVSLDPWYVQNPVFKLKFLRADRFEANKAALRMVRHFQTKLDLFGEERLVKDITQDDLEEGDFAPLLLGSSIHVPVRDSVGRLVRLTLPDTSFAKTSVESKLRSLFYSLMVLTDDVETQKKGIVLVSWTVGMDGKNSEATERQLKNSNFKSGVWSMVKLAMSAVPARHEALHFCYDNLMVAPIFALIKLSLSIFLRIRVRSHYGDKPECLRKLRAFGIPTQAIPFKGSSIRNISDAWGKRRKYETMEKYKSMKNVFVPSHSDILLGRGKRSQDHIGNMRLRNLVEDCKPVYDNASRSDKTLIAKEIVQGVKRKGHHFLKDEDAGWIEVDDMKARQKVSHTFRDVIASAATNLSADGNIKRERDDANLNESVKFKF